MNPKKEEISKNEKILFTIAVILLAYLALFPNCQEKLSKISNIQIKTLEESGFFIANVVNTGSMGDFIPKGGAKAIVKEIKDINDIHIGNVVVFFPEWQSNGLMHRIIGIQNETIIIKGDANEQIELIDFNNETIFKVHALVSLE